jgi:hypothetical protein
VTIVEAGIEFSIRQSIRGHEASEEVLSCAGEVGAKLCLTGIRRRTVVGKMLPGSNADRILTPLAWFSP